jgi:hypothetical protein
MRMDLRQVGNVGKQPEGEGLSLTAGRRQLVKETTKWKRLAATIARVLRAEAEEG